MCFFVSKAPGMLDIDRTTDPVYQSTTRVVQAVRDMVKESSGVVPTMEQYVALVKVCRALS